MIAVHRFRFVAVQDVAAVAGAMQDTKDFDPIVGRLIEDEMVAMPADREEADLVGSSLEFVASADARQPR